jgi:hypothetical protein
MRDDILSTPRGRALVLGVTGAMGIIALGWTIELVVVVASHHGFGVDFRQYLDHTHRWLDTGQFYLPSQLAGDTAIMDGDILYPPIALLLLVPFAVLPSIVAILWWAIPLGLTASILISYRPSAWTWPIFACIAIWPRTEALILYGNPGMWSLTAIAAATRWGWPGPLGLLKPSLAPFALIGFGSRGWWLTLGIVLVACIPFGTLWVDYATVLRNAHVPITYSLLDAPLAMAPLVAWAGRRAR